MFCGATSFNQSLNKWDVSKVTDMDFMFDDASSFNQPLDDWNVSKEYETYVLRSKILQPAAQQVERVQSDGYGTDV